MPPACSYSIKCASILDKLAACSTFPHFSLKNQKSHRRGAEKTEMTRRKKILCSHPLENQRLRRRQFTILTSMLHFPSPRPSSLPHTPSGFPAFSSSPFPLCVSVVIFLFYHNCLSVLYGVLERLSISKQELRDVPSNCGYKGYSSERT
jgi:hypothetical protein